MIIPKPNGWIYICTYFKDVNKAYFKDDFSFFNMDTLVDNTIKHEMFSLIHGFFRYNQIMIMEKDKHKMVFITPWGNYYYRVMLFGIKKARATYQREMTCILHDIVEDYMDDLSVKIKI